MCWAVRHHVMRAQTAESARNFQRVRQRSAEVSGRFLKNEYHFDIGLEFSLSIRETWDQNKLGVDVVAKGGATLSEVEKVVNVGGCHFIMCQCGWSKCVLAEVSRAECTCTMHVVENCQKNDFGVKQFFSETTENYSF